MPDLDFARLDAANIAVEPRNRPSGSSWFAFIQLAIMVGFIGFIIYSFRSAQRGGGGGFGMGFGRSKAKLLSEMKTGFCLKTSRR